MAEDKAEVRLTRFGRKFLELLDAARKNLAFYPSDHPIVTETIKQIEYLLGDMFLVANEVTLALVEGEFYLNETPLKRESLDFPKLRSHLEARDSTAITFSPRVTAAEIHSALAVLARSPETLRDQGGARMALASEGVANMRVGRAVPLHQTPSSPASEALGQELREKIQAARGDYDAAVVGMRVVFNDIITDEHIDYRTIKATTEALIDSVVRNKNVWSHLLNVKHYDEYTFNHSVNVATIALLIGTRFGVLPDTLPVLGEAALLHDIGKQKVPREIVQKIGSLSEEEWVLMRGHPERGAKLLLNVRDVSEAAMMVAYEHHTRYDLKGYPHVHGHRHQHLFSHIVSVADIYDALTSDRGYRRALLPDMAMRILLSQSGTAFHPLVVKVFLNLVGLYPLGTFVRLKTGEIALVIENNTRDLLRPVIKLLLDKTGSPTTPRERDLSAEPGLEPPIEGSIDVAGLGLDLFPPTPQ